jgi:thymidylate synthase (FAD)
MAEVDGIDKSYADIHDKRVIVYGADAVPGTDARRTSRNTADVEWHGTRNMNSRRISHHNLRETRSPSDTGMVQVGTDGIQIELVMDFRDEDFDRISRLAQSAGSGAPQMLIDDKDADEALEGGLAYQSMEDFKFVFAVRGVTRAVTHMLVRTRQASFKQQSQQDTWQGDTPEFRMPESVWVNPVVRREWIAALMVAHRAYNLAIEADVQYKDARYIMPEGTANFILCEYDLRHFMEMYAYRGCVMFQEELVYVMRTMRDMLVQSHPYLDPALRISCEKVHKCTFQGPERVEETCTFPWAKEDNRVYRQRKSGFAQ